MSILELSRDPHPAGSKKLEGSGTAYRVRVGDYRVLYEISEPEKLVRVMAVGHRRDVYR